MKKLYLLLFLIILKVQSQNFETSSLNVFNNGGSKVSAKVMCSSKDGFIWYTTKGGIVKEMGSEREFFSYNQEGKPYFESIINLGIVEAKDQKVWTTTNYGISVFDPETETSKWLSITYPNTDKTVVFTSLMVDNDSDAVWLGTQSNYIFKYQNNNFRPYRLESYIKSNSLIGDINTHFIKKLDDKSLLIKYGKDYYNLISNTVKPIKLSKYPKDGSTLIFFNDTDHFPINGNGTYNFNNKEYSYWYDTKINQQIIEVPLKSPNIFTQNHEEITFISQNKNKLELYKLSACKKKLNLVKTNELETKKEILYYSIFPNKTIYVNTENELTKFNYRPKLFKNYLNKKGSISTRSIIELNKDLYVLTYSGLFKKGKSQKSFSSFKPKGISNSKLIQGYYGMTSYNEKLLIYGYRKKILIINPKTQELETYSTPKNIGDINDIEIIKNEAYLGSSSGLYKTNLVTNNIVHLLPDVYEINVIFRKNDNLYIGTKNNGVYQLNIKTNEVININNLYKLENKCVKALYIDSDNNLWIGCTQGLLKINLSTKNITKPTIDYDLINHNIAEIQEDDNSIWVASFNGLIQIDKKSSETKTYFTEDGLTNNEFNFKSSIKTSDNKIIFGGLEGLNSFKANRIVFNKTSNKIKLIKYATFNSANKANKETITLTNPKKSFTLPYTHNYLTLHFAINDIRSPKKNTYKYRVKELNNEWINQGNYNTIRFQGLKPNKYTLEVKGINSEGISTKTEIIEIIVEEIFYKKPWFVLFIVLFIMGLTILIFHFRNKRLRHNFKQKEIIRNLEGKALRAQMNPHFIFNTLNGMQSVMILKGEREANKYFVAFSKLIRQTLDMSNSELITIENEINYLKAYLSLETLRLDDRLNYNIGVSPGISDYKIPSFILQPIVENSLLHGLTPKKEGELNLDIQFIDNVEEIIIVVTDNGIGRKASAEIKKKSNKNHKSLATQIMNQRISMNNQGASRKIKYDIIDMVDYGHSLGTKVMLAFPKPPIS